MNFDTKRSMLIKSAETAFSSDDDKTCLKYTREAAEDIAGTMILFHYEKVLGNNSKGVEILRGKIKYNDDVITKPQELTLKTLITEIARNEKDYPEYTIIKDSKTRQKIRYYFEGFIIHTNKYSHPYNYDAPLPVHDDALFNKMLLGKILVWFFKDFIKREIPSELMKSIASFAPQEWLAYIFYSNGKKLPDTLENLSRLIKKILESPCSEEKKMQALQNIDKGDFEKAKKLFLESAQQKSKKFDNAVDDIVDDYINAGILAFLNNTQEALGLFEKALNIKPNDRRIYLYLGHVYKRLGKYKESENFYRKVLCADTLDRLCVQSYAGLSDIKKHKGKIKLAEKYLENSLKIAREIDDKLLLAAQHSRKGELHFNIIGKLDSALEEFHISESIYKNIDSLDGKAGASKQQNAIANVYMQQFRFNRDKSKLDDAELKHLESLFTLEELGDIDSIATLHASLGNCYLLKDDFKNSKSEFFKALTLFNNIDNQRSISGALVQLSGLYYHLKRYKTAFIFAWYGFKGFAKIGAKESKSPSLILKVLFYWVLFLIK
jgi:tetratricopeptide (TPR) repeat protein